MFKADTGREPLVTTAMGQADCSGISTDVGQAATISTRSPPARLDSVITSRPASRTARGCHGRADTHRWLEPMPARPAAGRRRSPGWSARACSRRRMVPPAGGRAGPREGSGRRRRPSTGRRSRPRCRSDRSGKGRCGRVAHARGGRHDVRSARSAAITSAVALTSRRGSRRQRGRRRSSTPSRRRSPGCRPGRDRRPGSEHGEVPARSAARIPRSSSRAVRGSPTWSRARSGPCRRNRLPARFANSIRMADAASSRRWRGLISAGVAREAQRSPGPVRRRRPTASAGESSSRRRPTLRPQRSMDRRARPAAVDRGDAEHRGFAGPRRQAPRHEVGRQEVGCVAGELRKPALKGASGEHRAVGCGGGDRHELLGFDDGWMTVDPLTRSGCGWIPGSRGGDILHRTSTAPPSMLHPVDRDSRRRRADRRSRVSPGDSKRPYRGTPDEEAHRFARRGGPRDPRARGRRRRGWAPGGLTRVEFDLLIALTDRPGIVIDREQLGALVRTCGRAAVAVRGPGLRP